MENISKNKWQVRLAAVALFALGFIAGALVLNLYHARHSQASRPPGGGRFFRLDEVKERLNLTPDQAAQVEKIFNDTRAQLAEIRTTWEPKFNEIRRLTDEQLQKVLTPEQWQQFQSLKNEMRERHGRHRRDKDNADKQP